MQVGVVNREMVAVLTQGTLIDPEMLRSHADASYVLSIAEQPAEELSGQPRIGVCAVDCATGQILVGSWYAAALCRTCCLSALVAVGTLSLCDAFSLDWTSDEFLSGVCQVA